MVDSIVATGAVGERRARRARRWSRSVVRALLARARHGTLVVHDAQGSRRYGRGAPEVEVRIHDERTYDALLRGGAKGFGASYTDGWWDCDDVTTLVRYAIRNLEPLMRRLDVLARRAAPLRRLRRRAGGADQERDRANIRAHYDLGNDFYALMLDESMMYSCAYFENAETSLYDASVAKLERLCRKIGLSSRDRVVEIGSGWGGFALHAASRYGCRVTTVTISDAQYEYVSARVAAAGLGSLIDVRNMDYRDLTGTYDKLVSIEMIEAIGWRQLDTYFATCARLLTPEGVMALQAITIDDLSYERAKDREDFIKHMIFPGGFLPSLEAIVRSSTSASDLRVVDMEDIGRHYAETLQRWRSNLAAHAEQVKALNLGEEFSRMWHMYLCYCEAAFLERHISDVQLVLARAHWSATLGPAVAR
ncbi:MAG: class I SAM-dependent methyltransferase [Acidobacteriota bacterium]|nr:class I SAM-dependent methyltransferase [Acidobacteriota bacterium]